jgi:Zn-dependent peptidase ImmA (M78 family)/transcriptional regulator with XRE-family HTH domain
MAKKRIVTRVDRNLGRRLREARHEAGLSTRSVVKRLPRRVALSHVTLTGYENGVTVPPIDVLAALADVYARPLNWFLENRESLGSFRYRNLPSRVRLAERRQFEAMTGKWADAYVKLDRHLKHHSARNAGVPHLPREDAAPGALAATVRKQFLNLADEQPVQNVVAVLESFSAWTFELKASFGIEAATTRRGEDFVIVLNPDVANNRARMTAAHELAHVLYDGCKNQYGLTYDEVEKRAYIFASSLLLPESQLKAAFEGKSFLRLVQYKERFGVSLAAMIYMAEKNKVINTSTSRWLWAEMGKRGWRHNEPGYVWRDRAINFEMMLESAIQSRVMTWSDAERVTGVKELELRERISGVLETREIQPEFAGGQVLKFVQGGQQHVAK